MPPPPLVIHNARIVTPYRILPHGYILIEDGRITAVQEGNPDAPDPAQADDASGAAHPDGAVTYLDACGAYASPGFIDLHVHGGAGFYFMDGTPDAFRAIAALHARHGTTSMTPTTLSATKEELEATLNAYEIVKHDGGFLGMHLEGPYFALSQRGAQDPRFIRNPNPTEYEDLITRYPSIRRWSAAPELPGALAFGEYLRKKGVLPALAHTDAVYEEVLEAYNKGYTHATHLYSAMSGVHRKGTTRYAGAIESAFLLEDMTVEIIADGIHLPPPLLRLVYKIKGPDRTALITDAMRAAGMPPGKSVLGSLQHGLTVLVEDGVAKLPDRSAFAGSVATADRLVRNMVTLAEVPLTEAVQMMTSTPASIMGVEDSKGSLVPGKDADIVIFDEQIRIAYTLKGGRIVYDAAKDIP